MSIFSKAVSAVKNVATKAVGAVKKAVSSVSGKTQTAGAFKAPLYEGLNSTQKSIAKKIISTPVGVNTSTAHRIASAVIPGYSNVVNKSYVASGGRDPQAYNPAKISPSTQKLISTNVPESFNATDLSKENLANSEITPFETPSFITSDFDAGIGGYLGASGLNSSSTMGMTGSTIGSTGATGTGEMTDLEKRQQEEEKRINENQQALVDMMNELAGKPKEQAKLEKQAGLPQANAELRDLQAKQTLQTAQYMSQMQDIQNKPIAMEFIAGQQGEVQRRAGIDAMITSALIQGKQGQIQTAQDTVDRALKLKYDPIVTRIDTQKAILEMNYDNLSRTDKKLADQRINLLDLQKSQTTYDRDVRKTLMDNIYDGMKNGTIDSSTGNAQISQIMDENTKLSDIFKNMGITGQGNPGIVNGYDITSYATDPNHETKINAIVRGLQISNSSQAQEAIDRYSKNSPITGSMVISSANKYGVDPNVMFALMLNDSSLGTAGKAVRTRNPGNVGNDDAGNTRTYSSWNAGVDGVAEWLSKHKAKALYNGEFADTINNVVTFEPQKSQGTVLKNLQGQIANGNYKSVYNQIQNSVSKGLTGENKTRYDSARIDMNVLSNLQNVLTQYELAGGDTNLLKGSAEKITRKLGMLKTDPLFAQLAIQMEREFQNYRNQMTGAAFTPEESREYESVNPSGKKSFELNSSVITGAVNQLKNRVYSTEESMAGDGVKYIREYAMGIDPLLLKMNNAITGGGPTVSNSDYFNNL